jgi:hypothetical protein
MSFFIKSVRPEPKPQTCEPKTINHQDIEWKEVILNQAMHCSTSFFFSFFLPASALA